MNRLAFLDLLPAWARHLAIAFGAACLGSVVGDVIAASGVTGLDVTQTARDALDFGVFSAASAAAALWGLPITRQYGVGKAAVGDGEHEA